MKLLFFLFSFLTFPFSGGESTRCGFSTYVNKEHTLLISMSSDKFFMTIRQPHLPMYQTDTLAICNVTKITDEFFMIASENPESILQRSLYTSTNLSTNNSDSIKIVFDLPIRNIPVTITLILDDEWRDEKLIRYNCTPVSVMIPKSTERIFLGFDPEVSSTVHEHPHKYTFQGIITTYPTVHYMIDSGVDQITIRIPALTDSFFERYYVNHEFIRLLGDNLYWRGIVFTKTAI